MNQNSITNAPSIDSSTALTVAGTTALGVNLGRTGETTDVKGNLQVNGSAGTAGQVLTSAGAGLPPTWAAGGGGSSPTYIFRKPTTVQSIPHNTPTTVFFDTVIMDTTAGITYNAGVFTNTTSSTITVIVTCNIGYSNNATGRRTVLLNSSTLGNMSSSEYQITTNNPTILTATSIVPVESDATFVIKTFQNSGVALTLTSPTNIQILIL